MLDKGNRGEALQTKMKIDSRVLAFINTELGARNSELGTFILGEPLWGGFSWKIHDMKGKNGGESRACSEVYWNGWIDYEIDGY